jgi:hypothetical protein
MELFHSTREQRRVAWWILLSALGCNAIACATALLLLPTVVRSARNPVLALISSIIYVGLVVVITAGAAEMQVKRLRELLPELKRTLLLTQFSGIPWLPPVILLCQPGGTRAIFVVGALAFADGKLLARFESLLYPVGTEAYRVRNSEILLGFSEISGAARQHFRVTGAVCVAYVGVLAAFSGKNAIAVVLIALSCFFIGRIEQHYASSEKQSAATVVLRFLLHAFWASFLTFLALLPHVGYFGLAQLAAQRWAAQGENSNVGKLQSGVILFVKRKPSNLPELPPKTKFQARAIQRPFSIPFSGEYWFFQQPRSPLSGDDWFFQQTRKRPPASSLKEEGDPTTLNMTLEDSGAMVMQAQQRIGRPLDIHCCHWIDVVLNGEDQQPQYVAMELLLVDSSVAKQNIQTLGAQSLASPFNVLASANLKSSTFRFAIPRNSAIHSFNELFVWFHLKPPRMDKSATIRIDRFVLVP